MISHNSWRCLNLWVLKSHLPVCCQFVNFYSGAQVFKVWVEFFATNCYAKIIKIIFPCSRVSCAVPIWMWCAKMRFAKMWYFSQRIDYMCWCCHGQLRYFFLFHRNIIFLNIPTIPTVLGSNRFRQKCQYFLRRFYCCTLRMKSLNFIKNWGFINLYLQVYARSCE